MTAADSEAATAREEAHAQLSAYAEQLRVQNEELQQQLAAAAEQVWSLRRHACPAKFAASFCCSCVSVDSLSVDSPCGTACTIGVPASLPACSASQYLSCRS